MLLERFELVPGALERVVQHLAWPLDAPRGVSIIDLGDISAARGTESYLPLWLRLWGALGTGDFNIEVVR